MKNGKSESGAGEKMTSVKEEVEDCLEEEDSPLYKRHKQSEDGGVFAAPASQYNPLDEPSPLGLRLRKSPSLLELIQMKLSQGNIPKDGGSSHSNNKKEAKSGISYVDKMKASNFPASILKIGTWEYKSRYEGDLVVKCYFAKHNLVWEVLDGGLKNKIEIQWSDILALKAKYLDDGPGTLNVVLARQPLFFRETNPQPRKHTLWQATSDFTGGQASIHREHFLECPQGLLGKHFEKFIQCNQHLNVLSRKKEITLDSPYFEPSLSVSNDPVENKSDIDLNTEESPSFVSVQDSTSLSEAHSYSMDDLNGQGRLSGSYNCETPSPCSAKGALTVVDIENGNIEQLRVLHKWDQIKITGLCSSMSMSDLVSHLERRISEQGKSDNPNLSSEDWQCLEILDDINRCLFNDSQSFTDSDENSLMSMVNSLCCLLQKDTDVCSNTHSISGNRPDSAMAQKLVNVSSSSGLSSIMNNIEEKKEIAGAAEYHHDSGNNQTTNLPKNDSVGDLLLNLPRIASLPQFLFNIFEDFENKAR